MPVARSWRTPLLPPASRTSQSLAPPQAQDSANRTSRPAVRFRRGPGPQPILQQDSQTQELQTDQDQPRPWRKWSDQRQEPQDNQNHANDRPRDLVHSIPLVMLSPQPSALWMPPAADPIRRITCGEPGFLRSGPWSGSSLPWSSGTAPASSCPPRPPSGSRWDNPNRRPRSNADISWPRPRSR